MTQKPKIGKAAKEVVKAMLASKGKTDNAITSEFMSNTYYVKVLRREIRKSTFEQVKEELGLVFIPSYKLSAGSAGGSAYILPNDVNLY